MQKGDIFDIQIEKLLYEGMGLAHIDTFAIFVENACDEDILKVEITQVNKNYAKAKIAEIITPSQYRLKDKFCALSNVCGGCQWSFIDYEHQLLVKQNIIKEALHKFIDNTEIFPIIPCNKTSQFRHKIQLPVSQTKNSKRFLIGYYKPKSHEIVNIKHCEIQPYFLDEVIEDIRIKARELNLSSYDEKTHKGLLRHIVFRISQNTNEILLTFVINDNKIDEKIVQLSNYLSQKFSNIVGICVNFNTQKNNVILGRITEKIIGKDFYTEQLGNKKYQISSTSFFQTNPYIAKQILDVIKNQISKKYTNPTILDAYSGVSTFGIYLSDIAKSIICVESEKSSSDNAKSSLKLNNIQNIEIINADATKTFAKFINENKKFDVTIIDPPRKGSTKSGLQDVCEMTKNSIFYVSCNPQTLARDAQILEQNDFKLAFVQGADMFPHSYHIETIARFDKSYSK